MNKNLKLSEEEAIKYYNNSNDSGFKELLENTFGKGFATPKNIYETVNNFQTLKDKLGYDPRLYSNPSDSFQKYLNACVVLAKVAEIYNEGTKLDWKNTKIYKYMPYKYFDGGSCSVLPTCSWYCDLSASARFYYKSAKLSEQSYNNFKEYWEDYWSEGYDN